MSTFEEACAELATARARRRQADAALQEAVREDAAAQEAVRKAHVKIDEIVDRTTRSAGGNSE